MPTQVTVAVEGTTQVTTTSEGGVVVEVTSQEGVTVNTTIGAVSGAGGITQLTGDVTAGPGSGSQAATLAASGVTPGSYTNMNATIDAKGRVTAASNGSGGDPSAGFTLDEGANIPTGTTTGSQFGTDPSQKLALWGATPIVQPAALSDISNSVGAGSDGVDFGSLTGQIDLIVNSINALNQRLRDIGGVAL